MMVTILAGLFVLGVVIAVHEFGHLTAAKLCGVKVRVYSIGFGKKLLRKKIGETEYCMSIFPFGGYAKLAGHNEEPEVYRNDRYEELFFNKSVWQRMGIVAAGPVSNYLLAFIILANIYFFVGYPVLTTKIGIVVKDSPAMEAGIKEGDRVIGIDGAEVKTWDELSKSTMKSEGKILQLLILRGDNELDIEVQPEKKEIPDKLGEVKERWVIGIGPGEQAYMNAHQPLKSLNNAYSQIYEWTTLTAVGVSKMIQGKISAEDNLGGPITIVALSGKAAQSGIIDLIYWLAYISFAVGFFNFLPIPVVDGGYLAFFFLEIVRGRPLDKKMENLILNIGAMLLFMLLFYIIYIDIMRLALGGFSAK